MVLGRGFKRFPLPMALGNDICRISRIEDVLRREPNMAARFIRRVLTEEEIRDVRNPKMKQWIQDVLSYSGKDNRGNLAWADPMSDDRKTALERTSIYLAGRWAAKEAVIKAHPHRRILMGDIFIHSSPESLRRHGKEGEESKTKKEGKADGEEIFSNKDDYDIVKEEEEEKVVVSKEGDEIGTRRLGKPVAIVRGRKEIGEEDTEVLISISHDDEYASAVCLSWTGWLKKKGDGRAKEKKSEKASVKAIRWRLAEGAGGV